MTTRLGRYCDRVSEAGWLAAVILTPLFFNVYSSRVFEPDKLTLLRCIALLMAAAWLIGRLEQAAAASRPAGSEATVDARTWLGGLWRSLTATPLMLQVLLLVLVYLVATLFSIVPRISFWGSYQRLQGTYTMLTYVVIFFITWHTLHTRAQLERLLNVIVLTSVPIALYGVIQHVGQDPLPWGGDVINRVTGNLGNAIFIAAYLIMAFFVTLERTVSRFKRMLVDEAGSTADALMGAAYLFTLALQAVAIYFSKSRGPWLGLLGGAYVFVLLSLVALRRAAGGSRLLSPTEVGKAILFAILSPLGAFLPYLALIVTGRGRRWLWLSWCIQSLLGIAFLIVFNLPQSPLAPLRQIPGFGRLGQVFETDTGTGRVRVLIWEGSVELIKSDPVRALIGYGPESMYVAFNRFYPPDLAHYEARNASPDRAHNETFDALVSTGVIGFLVYMWLFVSIFWHALRWLGFLPERASPLGGEGGVRGGSGQKDLCPGQRRRPWQQALFLGLAIGGTLLGAVIPLIFDHSLRFAGVGMPAGLIAGVAIFLAVSAAASPRAEDAAPAFGQRELLLIGLLAMVVAHFIEIHFGIAIVATRVYFWMGLALLLGLGSGRLRLEHRLESAVPTPPPLPARHARKRKRRTSQTLPLPGRPKAEQGLPLAGAVVAGLLGALIIGTLFFDYTINLGGHRDSWRIFWSSLTSVTTRDRTVEPSAAVLGLVAMTWLLGTILVIGEGENLEEGAKPGWWARALPLYLSISAVGGTVFGLVHAAQLVPQSDISLSILTYVAFVCGAIFLTGRFLCQRQASHTSFLRPSRAWSYPLLLVACGYLIFANTSVVRADMYYKVAWDNYHRPALQGYSSWSMDTATVQRLYDAALYYYDLAMDLAPDEDYYLLFFGKAFLEMAETTEDQQLKLRLLREGEARLKQARDLNPLNTDHTANLARLYRTWALGSPDAATREAKLAEAERYYGEATKLSPQNAALYNEWGQVLLDMGRHEESLARYQQSLALDDRFSQTFVMLGEYYLAQQAYDKALPYYQRAQELDARSPQIRSKLGYLYAALGDYTRAISEYVAVTQAVPNHYGTHRMLANLYGQTGRVDEALREANLARSLAPENERADLDRYISQLQALLQQGAKP